MSVFATTCMSGVLGLLLGSFANVCIYRMPQNQSIVTPRSRCMACGHTLRPIDNIPVISFLVLHGRCHFCRATFSWQYPLVELGMGLLFVVNAALSHGDLVRAGFLDLLTFYLLTLSVIDFHHRIIPDELSLSLLAIGWASAMVNPFLVGTPTHRLVESLVTAVAGGGLMFAMAWMGEKIFKKEALGGGDIKLVAGLGAYLGWMGLWGTLILGSFLGGFIGLGLIVLRKKGRGDTLPFGPFLSLGAFLTASFSYRFFNLIFP